MTLRILAGGSGTSAKDDDFNLVTTLIHANGSNAAENETFIDSSDENHTVSRGAGAVKQGTFSPFSAEEGKWSIYFNGGDHLQVPTSSDFIFNADFTIEMWVFRTVSTTNGEQMYEGRQGGDTNRILFWINASNQVSIFYNGSTIGTSSATVPLNQWSHIALTRDGTSMQAYIDGTRVISITENGYIDRPANTLYIGKYNASGDYDYKGYISNLRVNRGTAHYTGASATVPTSPFTGITGSQGMLTCASNIIKDKLIYSSLPRHTVTTGTGEPYGRSSLPRVLPFSPFAPSAEYSAATHGGSAFFTGTGNGYLSASDATDFDFGTDDFCIEGWFYPTSTFNTSWAMVFGTIGVNQYWAWTDGGGNESNAGFSTYPSGAYSGSFTHIPQRYSWNHCVWQVTGGYENWYLNGKRIYNGQNNPGFGSSQTGIYTGMTHNYASNYFYGGYISDVRIIKGNNYNPYANAATLTIPTAPLTKTSYTKLLYNFTNAKIIDHSGKQSFETVNETQLDTTIKKFGTASAQFDGTGDSLTMPEHLAPTGTTPFTIEGFIYVNANKNYNCIYSAGYGIQFYTDSDGKLIAWIGNAAGFSPAAFRSTNAIATTTWTHFALVRDTANSTLTWFINGTANGQTTSFTTDIIEIDPATYKHTIGTYESGTYGFNGYIDEFRITHKARYTSNFTAPTKEFFNK